MVPSAFVLLDAMPLTTSGKVDRKALPAPGKPSVVTGGAGRAPRDETEAKLAAIFRNVLGVPAVGVSDSFFDLGGHSLLAMRLVAEIEGVFGRAVPLVTLFKARSVEQLAAVLRSEARAPSSFELVPIQPVGTKRPLFLMSRPNVNSLGYIALARYLEPDRPVYGLQYQYAEERDLGRPYTYEEYEAWAKSYAETIRLIQPSGPYLLGGMCEGAIIAFTTTRLLEAAGEKVALLAVLDAWPQENTVRKIPHRVHTYEGRLRALAKLDRREQLRVLARGLANAIKRVTGSNKNREPSAGPSHAEILQKRLWPGKDFVPPTVSAKITVFRLKRQPYWRVRDDQYGWGNRTTTGVEVHVVPGDDHHNLLREPEVATSGRVMDDCVRRADPIISSS
jgi:thioesterase domain-containing protein/acyl carrier protein